MFDKEQADPFECPLPQGGRTVAWRSPRQDRGPRGGEGGVDRKTKGIPDGC